MRLLILTFFVALSSLVSVQGQNRELHKMKKKKHYTTSSGLQITFYRYDKKALPADSGDRVKVHYVGKLDDGTIFDSSYDRKQPIEFTLGHGRVIKGWEEGLRYMHAGDSAVFVVPPELAYGNNQRGSIPPNSTLTFNVKMVELHKELKPFDVSGLDTLRGDSGLRYIVVKKGKGPTVKEGMRAFVKYAGYFPDGRKFDASFDHPGSKDFDFIIGRHQVIQGWDLGIRGMQQGEKRRLIVPYQLAYGERGQAPVIPPKADLIFDVVLSDFETVNTPIPYNVAGKDTITTASGLKYIMVKTTGGRQVKAGDSVSVHYTGYYTNGKIFDSSIERKEPINLVVGRGMVIRGWDEGLQLLKEGEKARLIIPYTLGYGADGRPPVIPPKATLIFDVQIVSVGGKK